MKATKQMGLMLGGVAWAILGFGCNQETAKEWSKEKQSLLLGPSSSAKAVVEREMARLFASDAAAGDLFGVACATDGRILAVGAYGDDDMGGGSGAVYLFERNRIGQDQWGLLLEIYGNDPAANKDFGAALGLSGDFLAVGAPGDSGDIGAVYIFERNTGGADNWGQIKKIVAPNGAAGERFGEKLSFDGNVLVTGDDTKDSNTGAVYVFSKNQGGANIWGQAAKLNGLDVGANDWFGSSMAVNGSFVLIGAGGKNQVGIDSGAAYLFERNVGGADNWGLQKKLFPANAQAYDHFGSSVGISDGIAAVGARTRMADQGSVYLFYQNQGGAGTWGEYQEIVAPDGAAGDSLGEIGLNLSQDRIFVSAPGRSSSSGALVVFERNLGGADSWGWSRTIVPSSVLAGDGFGTYFDVTNSLLVAGATGDGSYGVGSGSAYVFDISGNVVEEVAKPEAPDGQAGAEFGFSVAQDGDTLAVGAHLDDELASDAGAVYVFSRNTGFADAWGLVKKIMAPDGAAWDKFGTSVSVRGDFLAVGARDDDGVGPNTDSGSAYIFSRNMGGSDNWGWVTTLMASDAAADVRFGNAIALFDDHVVVGAYKHAGAAYVYARNSGGVDNWGQVKKLTGQGSYELFGWSVAGDHDLIVIGSERDDNAGGHDAGAAYVFRRDLGGIDNWGLAKMLLAPDPADLEYFGHSVAVFDDLVAAGAYFDGHSDGPQHGSVYVFDRNSGGADNWGTVKKIIALDRHGYDHFGKSVGLSGDNLLVGAYSADSGGLSNSGAAYFFSRNTGGADNWGQVAKLIASDLQAEAFFGQVVSTSGNWLAVGAPFYDTVLADSGTAYLFQLTPCQADQDCALCMRCATGLCVNQQAGDDLKDECPLDPCQTGACDGIGACGLAAEQAPCDDLLFCNGQDSCDVAGGCSVHTGDPCASGPVCQVICDEANALCRDPDTTPCDDAVACTENDQCQQGGCFGAPNHALCLDEVACTEDACTAMGCANTPNDQLCDDGITCTLDTCDSVIGCLHTADNNTCDDGVGCTADSCDLGVGCVNAPDQAQCTDNGLFCDGAEVCDPLLGCLSAGSPCVGQGLKCREEDDLCVTCLVESDCDDALFCNGAEHCLETGQCQAGGDPCDDLDACTLDTCLEAQQQCNNEWISDCVKPPVIECHANALGTVGLPYLYDQDGRLELVGQGEAHWSKREGPADFGVDENTGFVGWLPTQAGTVSVVIRATNSSGFDECRFSVEVRSEAIGLPQAVLVARPDQGRVPLSAHLDGSASQAPAGSSLISYRWNFGDGSAWAFGEQVDHVYESAGSYGVQLLVTEAYGSTASAQGVVRVLTEDGKRPPIARITASSAQGQGSLAVDFGCACEAGDAPIAGYAWDFADGNKSDRSEVRHTFEEGRYTVRLIVVDEDGMIGSDSVEILVRPDGANHLPPLCQATAVPHLGLSPLEVVFSGMFGDQDGLVHTWQWEFEDGSKAEEALVQKQFEQPGLYQAVFTVTDNDGLTCQSSVEVVVSSSPGKTPPKILSLPTKAAVCNQPYQYDQDSKASARGDRPIYWKLGKEVGGQILGKPEGMEINAQTGEISWTPIDKQVGANKVSLIVSNDQGADLQDFEVELTCEEQPSEGCGCATEGESPGAVLMFLALLGLARHFSRSRVQQVERVSWD